MPYSDNAVNDAQPKTKAVTEQPQQTLFDAPWLQKAPEGGLLFVLASAVASVLYLRRRLSADNTAITKDQTESKFVRSLMEELTKARKTLDEVYNERNVLIERVGSLQTEVRMLTREKEDMKRRMTAMERRLGLHLDSGHGALDGEPHDTK